MLASCQPIIFDTTFFTLLRRYWFLTFDTLHHIHYCLFHSLQLLYKISFDQLRRLSLLNSFNISTHVSKINITQSYFSISIIILIQISFTFHIVHGSLQVIRTTFPLHFSGIRVHFNELIIMSQQHFSKFQKEFSLEWFRHYVCNHLTCSSVHYIYDIVINHLLHEEISDIYMSGSLLS